MNKIIRYLLVLFFVFSGIGAMEQEKIPFGRVSVTLSVPDRDLDNSFGLNNPSGTLSRFLPFYGIAHLQQFDKIPKRLVRKLVFDFSKKSFENIPTESLLSLIRQFPCLKFIGFNFRDFVPGDFIERLKDILYCNASEVVIKWDDCESAATLEYDLDNYILTYCFNSAFPDDNVRKDAFDVKKFFKDTFTCKEVDY